jgi:hypothetical protein
MNAIDQWTVRALRLGMAAPALYFGVQVAAAPFYPGYSFLSRDASTLGTDGSRFPALFNGGAILVGVAMLVVAAGFLRALRRLGAHPALAVAIAVAIGGFGVSSINAGIFPMPDPRHSEGLLAALGLGLVALPLLLPIAVRTMQPGRALRVFLWGNALVLLAMVPVMSGLLQRIEVGVGFEIPGYQWFLNNCQGLLQRILAFAALAPIAGTAWFLAKRI